MLKTIVVLFAMAAPVFAQVPLLPAPDPTKLPPMNVTVFKDLDDASQLPVSVDAVVANSLDNIGARIPSDASIYAPNTFFTEFTARKLSNPRFRGVGSSPLNPGVTTYFDGVPQLNANSSSIELLDVEQVEFGRGALGSLYGRNALGGIISVTTRRPSLSTWHSSMTVSSANYAEWRQQFSVSGPIAPQLGMAVTVGGSGRQGYTVNDVTGRDLDRRAAGYFKGQIWWTPNTKWETRLIIGKEISHDGDYALNDLVALIENPFHASRSFEGDTRRDVFSTTFIGRYDSAIFSFSSITGFVDWSTHDRTDLDYTAASLLTRQNDESDFQFTQELRFAINTPAPVTPNISMMWQAGLFIFSQRYSQIAVNTYEPFLLNAFIDFPVSQITPQAQLNDTGFGLYGQTTFNFMKKFDLVIGLRADREDKDAMLQSSYDVPGFPSSTVNAERNFRNWSPQFAGVYHFESDSMVYASFGRNFKAGGFNAASPMGSETYGGENTYHVETGAKAGFAEGKVTLTGAAFFIDWNRMQFNLPDPFIPGQFYIANVNGARSRGIEMELRARPHADVDFFGGLGLTRARFDNNTILGGADVSRNQIPNAPKHTYTVGTDVRRSLPGGLTLFGHFDTWFNGGFKYDESNSAGQKAYSLVNFRAGARGRKLQAEFFMKNAADTRYIPVAFAYSPMLAPSGFIGEMGAPRRYGVSAQLLID